MRITSKGRTLAALAVVTAFAVGPLVPFLDKAFHIDDYSYLRAAQQIRRDPFRPYDFLINWRGTFEPAWQMMNKPPLIPYVLAAASAAFRMSEYGESERVLHGVFLVFPLVAGVSMYWLAGHYVRRPLWPTLGLLSCAAWLVGSTNLMLDNPSLALYLAALAAMVSGEKRGSGWRMAVAAILMGVASWANYLCLSLIPLAAAYLVMRRRWRGLVWLAIPAVMFGLWCVQGWWVQGVPDIVVALGHRAGRGEMPYFFPSLVALLTFTGGCVLPVVVLAPWVLRGWRGWVASGAAAGVVAAVLGVAGRHLTPAGFPVPPLGIALGAVFAFGAVAGFWQLGLFVRAGAAEGFLLVLWAGGVAVFLLFFNWTVAARFVVFLAPPVLIGAFAGLEKQTASAGVRYAVAAALSVTVTLGVSLAAAAADYRWANEQRRRAEFLRDELPCRLEDSYFLCHWGLQYYLEWWGLKAFDLNAPTVRIGSCLIETAVTSCPPIPPALRPHLSLYRQWEYQRGLSVQLQNPRCGAGFYTHKYGPLPYTVSSVVQENYLVHRILAHDR